MSRSISECNKAIETAWAREQQLVLEGKGTRDWTPEQQQDILDLDKGKAYGDDGRALQGHHMKSAEKHPECQGELGNIQFLSRSEHLAAHGGSWSNPTNGYFNPTTGETIGFGLDEFKPCEIIELTNPIDVISERITQSAAEVDTSKSSAGETKEAKPVGLNESMATNPQREFVKLEEVFPAREVKIVELNDLMATNAQSEFVRLEDVLPASQIAKNGGSLRSMPTQQTKVEALGSARRTLWKSFKSYAATYGINSMADVWAKVVPWLEFAALVGGVAILANASSNDSSTGGGNGNNADTWNSASNSDEDAVQIDEPSFQTEPADRSSPEEHQVQPHFVPSYTRKDGTKVSGYTRGGEDGYLRGGKKTDD